MRRIVMFFVLIVLLSHSMSAQTYQRKALARILNPAVVGSTYSFEIWAMNDSVGTSFFVGNSDFYFFFNATALSTPTLTNINPKYTGIPGVDNYDPMQVNIISGKIQVGVRYTGAGGGSSPLSNVPPDGERVCTVNLTITSPSQTAQLDWDNVNSGILTTGIFAVFQSFTGSDNSVLPVQLASFTGSVINEQGHVRLNWRTLTETNNYGFFVEKSQNNQTGYQTVSTVIPGHGTTLEPHDYAWTDVTAQPGIWYYRLKQVDLDGTQHFTEGILPNSVTGVKEKPLPTEFALSQNYPNPFNPTTLIEYAVPRQSNVKIEVYNLIGQRVATLVEGVMTAGYHSVQFNASGIASGLYFYRMSADGNVNFLKKMILMK